MKKRSWHEVAMPERCDTCPVRKLALFQPLTEVEVEASHTYRLGSRRLKPGQSIYRQGDFCNEVYTLFDGWAYLYLNLANGGKQILSFLLPGDIVGFQADMGDGGRMHSAKAITAVSLCVFPSASLLKMFSAHPDLGIRLTWMTARDEALAYEHLASLGRRSARERIAHLLLEIFTRVRARSPNPKQVDTIEIPLTQELIADASGLTHIHVSRTLKSLQNDNLVQLKECKLRIPNLELLASVANYSHDIFTKRPIL